MKNLDLVVLAGEFSHRELECDVSTVGGGGGGSVTGINLYEWNN